VTGAGTGAAGRLRPLAVCCGGLRGPGHLLGCPGDSCQAGQAGNPGTASWPAAPARPPAAWHL